MFSTDPKVLQNRTGFTLWSDSAASEMHQVVNSGQRPLHRQFDNIFKSRKIKEEVTLELILPNFSGK